jgi:hypothetical protein
MTMIELTLPMFWASALVNGDETGLDDLEQEQLDDFVNDMIITYGTCLCVGVKDDPVFTSYHDANEYGVLATDCAIFVFQA